MTTEEKNKKIALFMGGKYDKEHEVASFRYNDDYVIFPSGQYFLSDLRYHKSWDWLIPVVEKIRNSGNVIAFEISFSLAVVSKICYGSSADEYQCKAFESNDSLESVYQMCFAFVKWYQENNN